MGVSVLAVLVAVDGDAASYDLVADPSDPPVRVVLTLDGEELDVEPPYESAPVFVRAGVRAVTAERVRTGVWPSRAVRQS